MNNLFLIHGPPMVKPPNSSLDRGGCVRCAEPSFWPTVRVFNTELFSLPKRLPCQLLVPDLVMTFTTEPALRPYSGPNWLVTRTYCCTNSVSETNRPGPPTLLSLLFCPSICWSLLRPRRPLTESPVPPLVLENPLSRAAATPGTNNARLSRP